MKRQILSIITLIFVIALTVIPFMAVQSAAAEETATYTFSDYTAGTQYAENEEHILDDDITVVTNQCHFTTQLRIYSSNTYNGYAIVKSSSKTISSISINAGNKKDTLVIYGSNDDGATWTEADTITTTSTSYNDYTSDLGGNSYKWLKLDVSGSSQVRIASMTLTLVANDTTEPSCEHTNQATATVDATCTEAGSTTVTCDDCGETISTTEIPALGHSYADGVCSVCGKEEPEGYVLVTDVTSLKAGDTIIIAAKDYDYALSTTQNNNNRGQTAITKTNNTVTAADGVQIITLESGTTDGTFAFNVGDGYLYAASSGSNYLKTETTLSANSSWTITIATDGTATVTAQGTYTRNVMQYNLSSSLFACYSSASQKAIAIYKLGSGTEEDTTCEHTNKTTTTVDATCSEAGSTTVTCDDCGYTSTVAIPATGHQNTAETVQEATCTENGLKTVTCNDCSETISKELIEAKGHNYVDGICSDCGQEESSSDAKITVSVIIADYAASNGWANGTQYSEVAADGNITVSASTDGNNGKYYSSGEDWRIYQSDSGTVTFTAANGYTIQTIKITYSSSNSGTLIFNSASVSSGTTVTVNSVSATFSAGNTETATTGQARITEIEIVYSQSCNHNVTVTEVIDATCTQDGVINVICTECGAVVETNAGDAATGHSTDSGICERCGCFCGTDIDLSGTYYIAAIRESGNYLYMTSDLGDASTKRYTSKDSGLASLPLSISAPDLSCIFIIEMATDSENEYYIRALDAEGDEKYLGWSSGNSGKLVEREGALKLTAAITENTRTVTFSFTDTDSETRLLSLNNTDGSDYFAFYKGTQQGNLSLIPVELPELPEFSGASLNIGTDLSIRYHVIPGADASLGDYEMLFTMNGKEFTVSGACEGGKIVFSFSGIAPQCMGDTITAELIVNGDTVSTYEAYSVQQYAVDAFEAFPSDTKLHQLLIDLLHYGAAAQIYRDYNTDALVTSILTSEQTASTSAPTDADKNKSITDIDSTNTENAHFTAAGVRFDYNNKIYVKVETADISNVTVSVDGVSLDLIATAKENVYIAYSDGISALDFGTAVTFTLSYAGGDVQTLTYTVNSYALDKAGDTTLGNLVLALYRYGLSAVDYNNTKEA